MAGERAKQVALTGIRWSLAVFVNTLLNLVDAIAVGQLIFPRTDSLFQRFSIDSICLYLIATSAAQLVYPMFTSFGSALTAGMMAECVPFVSSMAGSLKKGYLAKYPDGEGVDLEAGLMPTILAMLSLHTLLIAFLFILLHAFKLGGAIQRFPKYVLLGAMGGIGLFLFRTAAEQSGLHRVGLLLSGLVPALLTIGVKKRITSPFVVPLALISLIALFYSWVYLSGKTWSQLREGNLLIAGPSARIFPFRIYKYWSGAIEWRLLFKQMPSMLASAAFAMMHLPINAPSFARTSHQDFSMNRELLASGVVNLVTSLIGLLPSYFIYTASVLFIQAGADSRVCSYILAAVTGASLWAAIPYIRFVPTAAVLFLLFYLGIALLLEALADGRNLTSKREYSCILLMMGMMMMAGFAPGLLIGVLAAGLTTWYDMHGLGAGGVDIRPRRDLACKWTSLNVYSPAEQVFLEGIVQSEILVLTLQGYHHFYNAPDTIKKIKEILLSQSTARFLLLNLSEVIHADLNMIEGLQELAMCAELAQVEQVLLVSTSRRITRLEEGAHGKLKVVPSLGEAVGWVCRLLLVELDLEGNASLKEDKTLIPVDGKRFERACARYALVEHQCKELLKGLHTTLIDVPAGSPLWHAGETLGAAFIVASGSFAERQASSQNIIRRYHSEAWIGLGQVLTGGPARTDCYALTDSRVSCIQAEDLPPRSRLDFIDQYYN